MWELDDDLIYLIQRIEGAAPLAGCHVALTGGVLYKVGPRKDLDLLFYRIRQSEKIDYELLFMMLEKIGITVSAHYGWCHKAAYQGKPIDIFFPEDKDAPNESGYGDGK